MKIDSHQHFWQYDAARDSWIDDSMQVLRRDYLPAQLKILLDENGIDGTVAVQADQSESETQFLLAQAAQFDWIKAVVGWVDLMADDIVEKLDRLSAFQKLCGFRHIVQAEPDDSFMLMPQFQTGIGLLSNYGFTYDILVYPHQLSAAIELTENHPQQIFVLDHAGKPAIKEGKKEAWATYLHKLADNKNVYCKLSGLVTEADHSNWTENELYPYLDVIFDAFGVERLMFGSDWPVCLLAGNYNSTVNLIKNYTAQFSKVDAEKIFGGNAVIAYGL